MFVTQPFGDQHKLTGFDCGKPELDLWLRNSARHTERYRTSRTFVWHTGDDVVVAYYSLAAHLIGRAVLPRGLAHGAPEQIPAVLLARLALDKTLHGRGLGGVLLADALRKAVEAGLRVGVRFVVVDAIDDQAAGFFGAHGFKPIPNDPHRLVRKASSIAADLDMADGGGGSSLPQ
jgi:GNAT superfamily N-acetyltransferase